MSSPVAVPFGFVNEHTRVVHCHSELLQLSPESSQVELSLPMPFADREAAQ